MTMHHHGGEEKVRIGSLVRAKREVVAHDAHLTWSDDAIIACHETRGLDGSGRPLAALEGHLGKVLDSEDHGGEFLSLVVAFEHAPCAVEVDSDDVELFMQIVTGGLS